MKLLNKFFEKVIILAATLPIAVASFASHSLAKSDDFGVAGKRSQDKFEKGGWTGGGGGLGIRIGGQIFSLAEAGVNVKSEGAYSLPAEAAQSVYDTLQKLKATMPQAYVNRLKSTIFGSEHKYRFVQVVDPNLYANVERQYQRVLTSNRLAAGTLVAFTDGDTTTIFPAFYELPPDRQALYLFHEGAVFWETHILRKPVANIAAVLRFEDAIYKFRNDPSDVSTWPDIYFAMEELKILSTSFVNRLFIKTLLDQGHQLLLSDFLGDLEFEDGSPFAFVGCHHPGSDTISKDSDYLAVLRNSRLHPKFQDRFLGSKVWFRLLHFKKPVNEPFIYRIHMPCLLKNRMADNFAVKVDTHKGGWPNLYIEPLDSTLRETILDRATLVEAGAFPTAGESAWRKQPIEISPTKPD